MAGFLSPISLMLQAFTDAGVVLDGGKIGTYTAGTTTPLSSYTDSTLSVANANPIILNAAGRLDTEVWFTEGSSTKLVVTDAADVVLAEFDNVPLLNDVSAILDDFLDPASGSGVDLVANAVKSFDLFSAIRGAPPPTLAPGQTLIGVAEGGTALGDGLGGAFYWSPTSTATDDGYNTLTPSTSTGAGRWLRVSWNAATGIDDTGTALQTLGWRDLPQNVKNADYTLVLADRGKQVAHTTTGSHTYTVPAAGTATNQVNWPKVAAVNVVVSTGTVFVVSTDTLVWFPVGSTGTRTLVAPADVVLKYNETNKWGIGGVGIT